MHIKKKSHIHTHTQSPCLSLLLNMRRLMIVELGRPLRGSKAALTPTTDSWGTTGHQKTLTRLYFKR